MKKRILYIATFPPPIHGSAIVSEQIKISKAINEIFDGDYINLSTSRRVDEIGQKGFTLKIIKFFRFLGKLLKTFILLCTHHYDLCYCAITISSRCFLRDAPFVLLCKVFGNKIVIHHHNTGMKKLIHKPVYRWLYPLTYNGVKSILLSWHLYSDIEKVVKKEDVIVCPNGIKPTVPSSFEHEQNDCVRILFLSNLLIDKGVITLLDALSLLKKKNFTFTCDFVGSESRDFNTSSFNEEVSKRELESIVLYHGSKYGAEKETFWKRADIFVLPSFNEAFPLVNIEAMEYKLPIISTNVGGIPDEVKDGLNGFVVEPRDPVVLSYALEKLISNKTLRIMMGNNSRKLFEEKFTQQIFEENIVKCFLEVIG